VEIFDGSVSSRALVCKIILAQDQGDRAGANASDA
jgi:hypothetical protein